jgi:hypothetical protein
MEENTVNIIILETFCNLVEMIFPLYIGNSIGLKN